ncbi:mannosyl-glycoprotein endo-beta-N-acetylglucosaminidase [Paenibacillus cellulosilyticus]|uniref:Mannosyl-glycoprotein endo-beta-N-acetylglucosaminidase n=1 Tax=Paenibacillus cellulosilyticus TaxID=375489 RepID=A0A2V2YRT4_9BACL|nr:glucosaminidase domain-containing protein [Paenibacillus cellulosilyticus]PWW00722.1 mannosyl-glycoprotein endo-beta-N-acetylglucosaminidase [Paenibacillus cellulosilyticus]QKS45579.1 glucosaminidase domain-containing protein [Paenibacillus cellulosilyticus]
MSTDNANILTPTELRNIRAYVQHKFADLPQDKHADIVADAVRKIVYRRLPDFAEDVRNDLTTRLIRTALLERSGPVNVDDIVEVCLPLQMDDAVVFEPFHAWVEQQLQAVIQPDNLREALANLSAEDANRDKPLWQTMVEYLIPHAQPLDPVREGSAVILPFVTSAGAAAMMAEAETADIGLSEPASKQRFRPLLYGLMSVIIAVGTLAYGWYLQRPDSDERSGSVAPVAAAPPSVVPAKNELPASLQYREIDMDRLAAYLNSKNSLLAEAKYTEPIIAAAEEFGIDPLLMFAITGQEQAFVPRDHERAMEIANNPFNVFHSWMEYNTTIKQSARIAARTIVSASKNRPEEIDPFTWINIKYAEDKNWAKGVRSIWSSMSKRIAE